MSAWTNGPIVAYHGTDTGSLEDGSQSTEGDITDGFAIDLLKCRPATEFGRGFYVTTWPTQAREWANSRRRRRSKFKVKAMVLEYRIDRDLVSAMDILCFARASPDFFDFASHCRNGGDLHGRLGSASSYDIVVGPVTQSRRIVLAGADQISFHTEKALKILSTPRIVEIAGNETGYFEEASSHGIYPPEYT